MTIVQSRIGKFIGDVAFNGEHVAATDSVVTCVVALLNQLTERERDALIFRYGLEGKERTLQEVADELSSVAGNQMIKSARAGQIVQKGIRRMRHPARIRPLFEILRTACILGDSTLLLASGERRLLDHIEESANRMAQRKGLLRRRAEQRRDEQIMQMIQAQSSRT